MSRRGMAGLDTKYQFSGGLSFGDLLGDPERLTVKEFKKRANALLGYDKLVEEEGDDEKEMIFYTVQRTSHTIREGKHKGERRYHNIRHYDDSILEPYEDVYHELRNTIGKLDINEMDDTGCERLAAAVLEEVFKDYKYAYAKSKSQVKETKKAAEIEMEWAVWRMEHGIGSTLQYLPPTEDILNGLEAQVDKEKNPWRYCE